MKRTAATLAGVGIGVAGVLGGCSPYQAPRFSLEEVRHVATTPAGTELEFIILAENRNSFPLPLREVDYGLLIEGEQVFSGVRSAEATVHRYGVQRFSLPAVAPPGALPEGRPFEASLTGRVEYVTPGALAQVLFDTGLRRTNAPLRVAGTVAEGEGIVFESAPEASAPVDTEPAQPTSGAEPSTGPESGGLEPEPEAPPVSGPEVPPGRWNRGDGR